MNRFSPQLRDLSWLVARPIAHRGLHDKSRGCEENCASAFTCAMAGNYAIECDVQLTSDGEAVVFHDATLDRLIPHTGRVRDMTATELQHLDFRIGNERMQTLGELLDQVAGRVPLVIELKTIWDQSVNLALRAVKVLEPYAGPYGLMSYDPDLIAAVAERSPATVRGIVADRIVHHDYQRLPLDRRLELRHFEHLPRTRPQFISFDFHDLPFAPVQVARAAGFPVITFTIKNALQAQTARRWSDQITFEGFSA